MNSNVSSRDHSAPASWASYVPTISMEDYFYELPAERIAAYPPTDRGQSKLLVAEASTQSLYHRQFSDILTLLPSSTLLVANTTKVFSARIRLRKSTGGRAEVLCLHPLRPGPDPHLAFQATSGAEWHCIVGGKRIEPGDRLVAELDAHLSLSEFSAEIITKEKNEARVRFTWAPEHLIFADIVEQVGATPLPPYIKRAAERIDKDRYQTVYAEHSGSVAAPTAGLHFTDSLLRDLRAKGVERTSVALHVGAGTFAPVQGATIAEHAMHSERIEIARTTVERLAMQADRRAHKRGHPIVPVGTTSVRTLESLYWFGVRLATGDNAAERASELSLDQWAPYRLRATLEQPIAAPTALEHILRWMDRREITSVDGETKLCIAPGYSFALCDALFTNFHQPHSTLLLLVAAFLGRDLWRRSYAAALDRDYRFLSYGDCMLLVGEEMGTAP